MAAQYVAIKRISSLDTPITAEKLDGSLFTTEKQAHEFIISVRKNGVKQTVTGSVSGKFIRANGTTIFLQGSISNGDAVVRLHQDCYNVQGRFTFNIFNTQSGVTTCIYSAVGKMDMGSTETVIDAGDVVPDISDVVAKQEEMTQVIEDARTATAAANQAAVAGDSKFVRYDSSQSLTSAQKSTARSNIDSPSNSELSELETSVADLPIIRNNISANTSNITSLTNATSDLPEIRIGIATNASDISGLETDIEHLEEEILAIEPGLSDEAKTALLACFAHVAWIGSDGLTYYNTLKVALKTAEVVSISAVYDGTGHTVYAFDSLDSLRDYLVVKATYTNGKEVYVNSYTLSGELTVGQSTVTVTFNDKTTTFTVNVSSVTVSRITCSYTQGGAVYETDTLDSLKNDLVVTAHYSNSTSRVVDASNYSLSGNLVIGNSTISVSYGGKTSSFTVVVSPITVPKRFITSDDIGSHVGMSNVSVTDGTISATNYQTFGAIIFDQSIDKMWFVLHVHPDSRVRPRYVFRVESNGSFYAMDEGSGPAFYRFDISGSKYNASSISVESISTVSFDGNWKESGIREMELKNGILTVKGPTSTITFTNANCFGYWNAVPNSSAEGVIFENCEVEDNG